MKLDAVLHIPMSEYCCGLDERRIVYRLRCARGDMKRVTLFYADTACRVNPILFTSVPMEKILSDACHDYWQVIVDSPYNRVYYYFQLDDGAETTLYYSNLFTDRLAQDRSEYFKLPFNHRSDIARVPACITFSRTASPPANAKFPGSLIHSVLDSRPCGANSAERWTASRGMWIT